MVHLRVWSMMLYHRLDTNVAKESMPALVNMIGFVTGIVRVPIQYLKPLHQSMEKLVEQVIKSIHNWFLVLIQRKLHNLFVFIFTVIWCVAAKSELIKSKLPNSVLSKIWKLADYNADGEYFNFWCKSMISIFNLMFFFIHFSF